MGGGGYVYNLTATSADDVAWCLAHMRSWLRLAAAEIAAEFPDYEVCQAFRIFELTGAPDNNNGGDERALRSHVARLALACQVDRASLLAEFRDMRHEAQQHQRSSGCDSRMAWKSALARLQSMRRSTRDDHCTDALRPVVQRWLAFAASTSGVEQSFTKILRGMTPQTQCADEDLTSAYAKLLSDACKLPPLQQKQLAIAAQKVWSKCYGRPRLSGVSNRHPRLDRGRKRAADDAAAPPSNEQAFLRRRRKSVGAPHESLSSVLGAIDEVADVAAASAWSERHERELEFARDKEDARRAQAHAEGVLLPGERQEHTHVIARDTAEKRRQNFAERIRKRRQRLIARLGGGALPEQGALRGRSAFTNSDSHAPALHAQGMVRVLSPWDASVFVLTDVALHKATDVNLWAAALRGGLVLTPEALHQRQGGSIVKFKGCATPTFLYTTALWRHRHARVWECIRCCLGTAECRRWKLLGRRETWRAKVSGWRRTIALVTQHEREHEESDGDVCVVVCLLCTLAMRVPQVTLEICMCVCACVRLRCVGIECLHVKLSLAYVTGLSTEEGRCDWA